MKDIGNIVALLVWLGGIWVAIVILGYLMGVI